MHHPFRYANQVYTLRPVDSCHGCAFDQTHVEGAEREARGHLCKASPQCNGGAFALFEPSDYAILVARGDSDD